jgi:Sigma-70 region 2
MERMILEAMPNARKQALRDRGGLETDDAIGIAYLTLVEAAPRFDPTRGVTFWQFARRRITGALKDAMRKVSTTHRRPGAVEAQVLTVDDRERPIDVPDPRNLEARVIAHVCVARAVKATKSTVKRSGVIGRGYAVACLMAADWTSSDIRRAMPEMSHGLMGVTKHWAMAKMRQELGA